MKHAHQDIRCRCRIGQRAQDIEYSFDTQLAAHRGHVFHGRMVVGREHKTHAIVLYALGNRSGG